MPPVGPNEVHIWKVSLASTTAALADLPAILSPDERERAARFAFEKDQARFTSCRATLRLLLSRYTGIPPESLVFRYKSHGKPALAGGLGWQFNVSHSRDLAAIAISRSDHVGIDLEYIDPAFPQDEVAPEVLCPGELRDLASLPSSDQLHGFFQLWTLKEALLKALGGGLSLDPVQFHIRFEESQFPEIISAPTRSPQATLHCLSLDPDYAAALAVLSPVSTLSHFTY
jgi:4'-phosphopantetheinyl transferase